MQRHTASLYDVRKWLLALKRAGFRRFMFGGLPMKLQVKNILHKAAANELIKNIGRDKGHNNVIIWEI